MQAESVNDNYKKFGQRGLQRSQHQKSNMAPKNNVGGDIGGHIHVPRKFARKHARGISFNSTGKTINDRDDESSMNRPHVNSLVYDKATLEAEKEQERLRKEKERLMQSEPLIMYQGNPHFMSGPMNADGAAILNQNINNNRPNTKQVTFRNEGRMGA
jgi:hypothetical protein